MCTLEPISGLHPSFRKPQLLRVLRPRLGVANDQHPPTKLTRCRGAFAGHFARNSWISIPGSSRSLRKDLSRCRWESIPSGTRTGDSFLTRLFSSQDGPRWRTGCSATGLGDEGLWILGTSASAALQSDPSAIPVWPVLVGIPLSPWLGGIGKRTAESGKRTNSQREPAAAQCVRLAAGMSPNSSMRALQCIRTAG
jgi:hypothetical protein